MYVESAESAVLSKKIREMVKTVTYEATGHCVAYYSIQQRIHNVLCATHIPNGYICQYKNLYAAGIPTFSLLSTVRDIYRHHIYVGYQYNGLGG